MDEWIGEGEEMRFGGLRTWEEMGEMDGSSDGRMRR